MAALPWPQDIARAIVYHKDCYILARGGEAVIGSTMDEAGFQPEVTSAGLARIFGAAMALCPSLLRAKVRRTWAGLRPMTPDGLPIIGPEPLVQGLWYATGHGRNGILLAGDYRHGDASVDGWSATGAPASGILGRSILNRVQPRVPFVLSCFRTPLIASGLLLLAAALPAQIPQHVEMERSGFVRWLKQGPNSPLSAIAQQKVGDGLRLGPADADIPLPGIGELPSLPRRSRPRSRGSGGQASGWPRSTAADRYVPSVFHGPAAGHGHDRVRRRARQRTAGLLRL